MVFSSSWSTSVCPKSITDISLASKPINVLAVTNLNSKLGKACMPLFSASSIIVSSITNDRKLRSLEISDAIGWISTP